jgi:hypothetical protein
MNECGSIKETRIGKSYNLMTNKKIALALFLMVLIVGTPIVGWIGVMELSITYPNQSDNPVAPIIFLSTIAMIGMCLYLLYKILE